ncbi:MAG TPA: hypothetical protein PKI92_03375, partial [Candidatus Woesebacteria bacterium]|nr:hypothetical protein [Candidatus Woesebacteria bacterium]
MTDNQSNLSYQDILDKYAESISSKDDHQIPEEKIKPEPELEPVNPPEPILTPQEEEMVKSQPEPQSELESQASPQIEAPPAPEAINLPPVTEAIIPPIVPPELTNESGSIPPSLPPKKQNHFFKYLFFFSLIIFIIVLVLVVISFLNSQKPITDSRELPPNNIPTSIPTAFCELNDQKYSIGQTFSATDGCNTCTCGEDLTISCTEKTCDLTPTQSATVSAIPKDWKTYENKTLKFSFSYPTKYGVFTYKTSNGDTGKSFIGSASGIEFGGISTDYGQGRMGTFLDFSGYANINGSITFKAVQQLDKSWVIDKKLISEIFTNQNNVEVVFVKGENATGDYTGPVAGTPGEGKIGALINLKNSEFPGIAF